MARDLGTRIVAAIFFGGDAFNRYAPIVSFMRPRFLRDAVVLMIHPQAIFVNIPATIFATGVYELFLRDSFVSIAKGHVSHKDGEDGLVRHLTKTGTIEQGAASTLRNPNGNDYNV
jgi:hypothetical protein